MLEQWVNSDSEGVKHCRGGHATGGGFEVEDGTALHWAAYYAICPAAELLIDKGAGH